ncbi:MAG: MFS transporter, partial [Streptosporangiaceae bacterium]
MTSPPSLRSNRNYRLLWTGGAISALGSRASALAMPLLVLALGGSAAQAGLVGFAATLPYLLVQLWAGVLVDRADGRILMLICDAGRLAGLASVVATLLLSRPPLAQLIAVAFIEGVLTVLHDTAEEVAVRHVVPAEQLPEALSGNEARMRGGQLLGQPIGGVLFGLTRWCPFAFDLFTYLVSIVSVALMRGRFRAVRTDPDGAADGQHHAKPLTEVREGIRWLWGQPFLRSATLAIAASNLMFQALTLVVIVVATRSGSSPSTVGLLFFGAGIGGVAGSLAAAKITRILSMKTVVVGTNWLWALLTPLIAIASGPILLGVIFAAMCIAGPVWNVSVAAYQMQITPEHLLGRVNSAIGALAFGALPIGSLLAGLLLNSVGAKHATLALGGLMAVVALLVNLTPAIRNAPE